MLRFALLYFTYNLIELESTLIQLQSIANKTMRSLIEHIENSQVQ